MRSVSMVAMAALFVAACATTENDPGTVTDEVINTVTETIDDAVAELDGFSSYAPPAPGTLLTLNSVYSGEADTTLNQLVVVTGEDFAIYANLLPGGLGGVEDLFIEYSGVFWQDCGKPALTEYQRTKLTELWPLEPADTVMVPFDGNPGEPMRVEVQGWSDEDFGGEIGTHKVVKVMNAYEAADYSSFAPALGLSLRIDWGEPGDETHAGFDQVTSIETVDLGGYQEYVDIANSVCKP